MQYFVERGLTHKETIEKIKNKYGDQARIMTFKTVRMGGFLGLGVKEGVEMAGYVQVPPSGLKTADLDVEKRKILQAAAATQTAAHAVSPAQPYRNDKILPPGQDNSSQDKRSCRESWIDPETRGIRTFRPFGKSSKKMNFPNR